MTQEFGPEMRPQASKKRLFNSVRNFGGGVVDGVRRRKVILSALAGGTIALVAREALVNQALSAPETISGTIDGEPKLVSPIDETLPDGTRIFSEPGVEFKLKVCKEARSINVSAGSEINTRQCTEKQGFMTEGEIRQAGVEIREGDEITVNSSDFFSGPSYELDR